MNKLYQTMNKKMLQLRIDADNHKSRCCWCIEDGMVLATDGYIGYILPERECYIHFTEDGHLNRMPVQVREVLPDNLLILEDLVATPDGMYYKTPDPEIYINQKRRSCSEKTVRFTQCLKAAAFLSCTMQGCRLV